MITYYFQSFQHKARPFAKALHANGFVPTNSSPTIAFFDRPNSRRAKADYFASRGAVIMEYPHSPLPPWWYDGIEPVLDYIKAIFVTGVAQQEAMKIIAPKTRTEVCGFAWANRKPFKVISKPRKILFAPIHPSHTSIRPEAREANQRISKSLRNLKGFDVFCRVVGSMELQGIKPEFNMIKGIPDGRWNDIDYADIVIAEGTYMYMAIARGKPTIGINQNVVNRINKNPERGTPKNWNAYNHLFAYPLDFDDATLPELIERAVRYNPEKWKERCMPLFNEKEFADKVRDVLERNKV